jgi:hypothetical protein
VIWLFAVLAAVTTFVIAAVSIGSTTAGLASRARRSVYDIEEAVEWVGDNLSNDVTAEISYDDVRVVLDLYLEYLRGKGVASMKAADVLGSDLIVVPEDERLAWILGQVDAIADDQPGAELTDEAVVAILAANGGYEQSIGAIGPVVRS